MVHGEGALGKRAGLGSELDLKGNRLAGTDLDGHVRPNGPLKPLPETTTLATVTMLLAEFESANPCAWVAPTAAEPKLITWLAVSGVWLPGQR